ncbi:MAG: RidA family protein [Gemmatimonadota bacterium]
MTRSGSIHTDSAPRAIGPYSQGFWAGELFFSAGQVALDPETMELVGDDAAGQASRVMANLGAVLEEAGLSFSNVVKTTVFLVSMDDFAAVNDVYAGSFDEPYPARSTVAVRTLPKGALVEIEVIARAG